MSYIKDKTIQSKMRSKSNILCDLKHGGYYDESIINSTRICNHQMKKTITPLLLIILILVWKK